jgi:hypothetical protein
MASDDDRGRHGFEATPDERESGGDRVEIVPIEPGHDNSGDGHDHIDFMPLPGEPPVCPPGRPPIRPEEPAPDEHLQIALERAKLIVADLESALRPAAQALRDGAWVSRRADEFSLELDDNIRQSGLIGERAVEAIEELVRRGRPDDGLEIVPVHPTYGSIDGYGS